MSHSIKTEFSYNQTFHEQLKSHWNSGALINVVQCALSFLLHLLILLRLPDCYLETKDASVLRTLSILYLIWSVISLVIGLYKQSNNQNDTAFKLFGSNTVPILFSLIFVVMFDAEDLTTLALIFILISLSTEIAAVILNVNANRDITIITTNMERGYLTIRRDMLCGMDFTDIKSPGNGNYFEIALSDIRYMEVNESEPCNLLIHHKHGTYHLCIQNPLLARKNIEEIIKQPELTEEKSESNTRRSDNTQPAPQYTNHFTNPNIPRYPLTGDWEELIICPNCGCPQNENRYLCYHCEQVFINGQPNIPFWCANCGYEGPYKEYCPQCHSSLKIYNT